MSDSDVDGAAGPCPIPDEVRARCAPDILPALAGAEYFVRTWQSLAEEHSVDYADHVIRGVGTDYGLIEPPRRRKTTLPKRSPLPDMRPQRQVAVRMPVEHYERLAEAAERFGVSPTTLSRMLISRGVEAIFAEQADAAAEPPRAG